MALTPYEGEELAAPKLTPYAGPEAAPAAPPSRLRRFVADPLISATKGAIGLPEAAVGVADIVTGGYAGKAAEAVGFRPKQAKEYLDTLYSPEQQQANAEVAAAEGFMPTVRASLRNPSTIAHTVIESAPSMLGGAGVARGLIKAGVPTLAAAAAGEGVVSAGSTAEQVRQETGDLSGLKKPLLAAGSGALTGVLSVAGGRLAKRFGITDIDVALAGGEKVAKKGMAKAVAGGVASEGLLEEMPQSAQETAAQNLATGKPAGQGVAKSAAIGALTGGVMGGGTSAAFNLAAKAAGVGKVQEDLKALETAAPEVQKAEVEALAAQVHSDDPVAATTMQAQTLDKLDAGETILPEPEKPATPETTRAEILESLAESVASGGELNPLEVQEKKVLESLKVAPTEPVTMQGGSKPGVAIPAPTENVAEKRAQDWLKAGRVVVKEGKTPDAEVAALLDDMGYTLTQGERLDKTQGGAVRRREWRVEKKTEPVVDPAVRYEELLSTYEAMAEDPDTYSQTEINQAHYEATKAAVEDGLPIPDTVLKDYPALRRLRDEKSAAQAAPQGPTPIADGETRQAYTDNPNLMIKRVGDKIALADAKSKEILGVAHVKDGRIGDWVDGKEPTTVEERAQIKGVMQEHLGVESPRFAAAWHGSPHDHTKFTTAKIGTGEGAQAYGYGLYFAESKKVAEWYKKVLSRNKGGESSAEASERFMTNVVEAGTPANPAGVKEFIAAELDAAESNDDDQTTKFYEHLQSQPGFTRKVIAYMLESERGEVTAPKHAENLNDYLTEEFEKVFSMKGRLYQVELAPKEEEYLLWDKPLSEQSEVVKAALEAWRADNALPGKTLSIKTVKGVAGGEFYRIVDADGVQVGTDKDTLADAKMELAKNQAVYSGDDYTNRSGKEVYRDIAFRDGLGDKAASEFLHSLGIRGIKYLDGSSRSKGDGNFNYVIFSDEDVEIVEKFNRAKGTGLPASEVQSHLAPIIAQLKVPVVVVATASEVPGLSTQVKFNGVFHRGSIYLNAENLTSLAEAEEVLLKHELRHAGLRAVLSRADLDSLLSKAWGDLGSGVREFAQEKGIETKSREGKLEAAEEYIVELARTDGKSPLWDRFVELFKAALRRLGFDLKLSEAELRSLVVRAGEAMKTKGVESGETRFTTREDKDAHRAAGPEDVGGASGELERVRAGVAQALKKPIPAGSIRISSGTEAGRHLSGIGAAFGKKVVLFEALNGLEAPEGLIRNVDPSTIYINVNASEPHMVVFGHELLHTIELSAPELYTPFEAFVRSEISAEGARKYLKAFPEPRAGKEVVADTVGALFAEKEFWAEMSKENPTLFQRVLSYVVDLIGQVFERHNGRFPAQATAVIYKDFDKIRTVTAKLVSDYVKAHPDSELVALRGASEITTMFSRSDVKGFTKELGNLASKRVLSDVTGNVWRNIMAVDRTIEMAKSMPLYAPIKELLARYVVVRKSKAAATDVPLNLGRKLELEFGAAFKTREAKDTFNDLVAKATLYELHADPRKVVPWTPKSWEDAGKDKQFGKSLGEARTELLQMWNSMTPEQRVVHGKIIDHMRVLLDQLEEIEMAPLREAFGPEAFAQAEALAFQAAVSTPEQLDALRKKEGDEVVDLALQISARSKGRLKGDYAPLSRFGNHIVRSFDAEDNRIKLQAFESKKKADEAVRAQQAAGFRVEYELLPESNRQVANIPEAFLNRMRAAAEKRGITGDDLDLLMDDFAAARVQTMPKTSLAGTGLKREGVEGYDTDMLRSYGAYVNKASHAIAYAKYGREVEKLFRDMDSAIREYGKTPGWQPHAVERMTSLKDKLYALDKTHDAERINELVKWMGKASFIWFLSSPSIYAVQWSQPFLITIPKLAARHGFGKALAMYVAEAKQFMGGKFSDDRIEEFNTRHENVGERLYALIEEERKAPADKRGGLRTAMKVIYNGFNENDQKLLILKVLGLQGVLDISSSHEFMDLIAGSGEGKKLADKVISKAAFFMQKSEAGSRRAAAVASFKLAMERGNDFAIANDYAADIISDTLGDFTSENRPQILRGNVGRLFGQFRFFQVHMLGKTIQLAKDAYQEEGWGERKKEMAYMLTMSLGLAGAAGTPLTMLVANPASSAIMAGIALAFGDPDDPWDLERDAAQFVREALGEEAGNTVLYGLPTLFGIDVHKRIGLGGLSNIVNGDPPPGMTATEKAQWYAGRLAGPAFGIVSDTMRAADALSEGDMVEAFKLSSPKILKDFVKGAELAEHGARGAGGRTMIQPEDISPASIALQLLGINPAEVMLAQEERRDVAKLSTEIRQRRSLLLKRVTEATLENDFDAREEALEGVNAWGLKNPGMKITQSELLEAVRRGRRARAGELSEREAALLKRVRGGD